MRRLRGDIAPAGIAVFQKDVAQARRRDAELIDRRSPLLAFQGIAARRIHLDLPVLLAQYDKHRGC